MKKLKMKRVFLIIILPIFVALITGGIIAVFAINAYVDHYSINNIYPDTSSTYDQFSEEGQNFQAGMILGAKINASGVMSDMLSDRVKTALNFYKLGIFEKFLISGDHGKSDYDEVNPVKNYLLAQGVPPEDIFMDHAGFDTYDSLYRAKQIFKVESLLIFTQEFHLPRAIYICKNMEIECKGIISDRQKYITIQSNERREVLAKIKAFADVLFKSSPVFLGETIPITGDSIASWD